VRRLAPAVVGVLAAAASLVVACDPTEPGGSTSSRFAAAKKEAGGRGAVFCEQQWPAAAPGARKYTAIPERELPERGLPDRPLPGAAAGTAVAAGGWKWVNLWATWCLPCIEEMSLLARWQRSLARDGIALDLELWSVDEDAAQLTRFLASTAVPGRVRWLRAPGDLPAVLASLGADRAAGIPVHALVDGAGNLRCLRVGAVHEEDYGAVKTILSGA
jgi:thiol-disulfide isomerase/thioredoxin